MNTVNAVAFAKIPVDVFMDERLSKTDIRVLGSILSFRNVEPMLMWPKREKIAERCGLSISSISRSRKRLVEFGWLGKV